MNHMQITETEAKKIATEAAKQSYKKYYKLELETPVVGTIKLRDGVYYVHVLETRDKYRTDILYWNVEVEANSGKILKSESGGGA